MADMPKGGQEGSNPQQGGQKQQDQKRSDQPNQPNQPQRGGTPGGGSQERNR